MTSFLKRFALSLALLLGAPQLVLAATAPGSGRWLVVFRSDTLPSNASALVARAGGQAYRTLPKVGVVVAHGDAAFAAAMAKNASVLAVGAENVYAVPETGAVEVAEADATAPDGAPTSADNLNSYQWDLRRIGAPALWSRLPIGDAAPTVAVLDTGVMHTHPDLVGQVSSSLSFAYCQTAGDDGYPDYGLLIDFDQFPEWSPTDGCTAVAPTYEAHGTHVAGTIAARFGGGRVVGVNPDIRIAAYKVFDRYRYTGSDGKVVDKVGGFDGAIFGAIVAATDAGIPVVSMSLGSAVFRQNRDDNASWLAWDRVAKYANRGGTLIVASAGNANANANGQLAHIPSDLSTVLSTSATGISQLALVSGQWVPAPGAVDTLASYSNYGSAVDLAAPGGDCTETACTIAYYIVNDGISPSGAATYYGMIGTSMATPHVSAVAATVRALYPDLTPGEVRSFLKETAQPLGDRQAFGHGLVDADAATR